MDFKLVLAVITSWVLPYSTAPAGCIHCIQMTLKVHCSHQQHTAFTHALCSLVTDMLHTCSESGALCLKRCLTKLTFLFTIMPRSSEGPNLWITWRNPLFVGSIMPFQAVLLTLYISQPSSHHPQYQLQGWGLSWLLSAWFKKVEGPNRMAIRWSYWF